MLLNITDPGIPSDKKAVDSVMLRCGVSAVMNAAACNNRHICIISDIKIIVYHLRHAALA